VNQLIGEGLSSSRVRHAHIVLGMALDQAVNDGAIVRNPARRSSVKLPRLERRQPVFIPPEDVERIAAACPEPYDLLIRLLVGTGSALGRGRRDTPPEYRSNETSADRDGVPRRDRVKPSFGPTKSHAERTVRAHELKPGTLRGPALGMDVDVVNVSGHSVGRGVVGELMCRQPWTSMTRGIWGDPQRYLDTCWSRFPGVWVHGDWANRDEDGFWFLHGRSDDTLSSRASAWDGRRSRARSAPIRPWPNPPPWEFPMSSRANGSAASWCSARDRSGTRSQRGAAVACVVASRRLVQASRIVSVEELPKTRSANVV
jgi:hypothetical protein